jgi:hypothetical protein
VPGSRSAWRSAVLAGGSVVTAAAGVTCAVVLLQPWRSCPEIDDSFLACPMAAPNTTLLLVSLLALGAALAVVVITVTRCTPARTPGHRPAGPVRYGLVGEPSTVADDDGSRTSARTGRLR